MMFGVVFTSRHQENAEILLSKEFFVMMDVKIRKIENAGTLLAKADVTLDDKFVCRDFRVIQGSNGPFVGMPTGAPYEKDGKKVYPDLFFPITKEAREELVKAIMEAYNATEPAAEPTA